MANTAVLCFLTGVALFLSASSADGRWVRAAARLLAAATCVVAAVTLAEYALRADFGFDHLLVRTSTVSIARFPGRPAPNTAVAFLLAGAALLFLDAGGGRGAKVSQILAAGSASVATFALLGYLFRLPQFYSVPALRPQTGMAIQAAIALLILAAGIIAARPGVGFMSIIVDAAAGGVMARRLMPSLITFLPVAFFILLGERRGWYGAPVVSALFVFCAMVESAIFILVTAQRLSIDDRRRLVAEGHVHESERRYRELFEYGSDGVFIADLGGRYTEVNDAGCAMLGRGRDDIVGHKIEEFILPEDVPRLRADRELLLRGGVQVSEWAMCRGDGTWRPMEVSAAILADGRWQAFVRDISRRKRQEAELERARENDRQLRVEIEQVTQAALTVSTVLAELPEPDVRLVLNTIGLQAQILTHAKYVAIGIGTDPSMPFDPWIHLGIPEEIAREIGRVPRPIGTLGEVAREGNVIRTANLHRHPAFRGLPLHHPEMRSLLGVPIRMGGRPVGNIYMAEKQGAESFTEQDQRMIEMLAARAAVAIQTAQLYAGEAQQRAWLNATIDQMPEGVILLDSQGRRVAINRAMLAFASGGTGSPDPFGNTDIFDVRSTDGAPVPFDELPAVRALKHGALTMGRELLICVADGRIVPVLANSAPVRNEQNEIVGATMVIQDITTMKELEKLREEWASVVAHDLRQPLGTVSLTAQALLQGHAGELPEKGRRAIERIEASSQRLNRMIDDLLDASLIEAKRLSIDVRPVDLTSLIESAVESLRESSPDRPVNVICPQHVIAWIDPNRIHQVLGNLLSNAGKYGRRESEIRVEVAAHDELLEVTVINWGAGIPSDELPSLFNRFRRSRDALAGRTPGLGLGLYVSKGLVEAHGGRMWAESVPGETTSFHFTIPRGPRAADQGQVAEASTPPS